jgi:hypothetical protein
VKKDPSSISAVKRRPSGYQKRRRKDRDAANVLWHRVTANFDEAVKRFAANPELGSPVTRLVFFKHLTVQQGMAARRYRDVVRRFEKFYVASSSRTTKSQNLEPAPGADQEIERHIQNGTLDEYQKRARKAKRQYFKALSLLDRFHDPVTGRNVAKDVLDDLVLNDREPPTAWRGNLAKILQDMADAFGVEEIR